MDNYLLTPLFIVAFFYIGLSLVVILNLDDRVDELEYNQDFCAHGKIINYVGTENEYTRCVTEGEYQRALDLVEKYESVFDKVIKG